MRLRLRLGKKSKRNGDYSIYLEADWLCESINLTSIGWEPIVKCSISKDIQADVRWISKYKGKIRVYIKRLGSKSGSINKGNNRFTLEAKIS